MSVTWSLSSEVDGFDLYRKAGIPMVAFRVIEAERSDDFYLLTDLRGAKETVVEYFAGQPEDEATALEQLLQYGLLPTPAEVLKKLLEADDAARSSPYSFMSMEDEDGVLCGHASVRRSEDYSEDAGGPFYSITDLVGWILEMSNLGPRVQDGYRLIAEAVEAGIPYEEPRRELGLPGEGLDAADAKVSELVFGMSTEELRQAPWRLLARIRD